MDVFYFQMSMLLQYTQDARWTRIPYTSEHLILMPKTLKLVLDVLKPHHPNALDFSLALADIGEDYRVKLTVTEVDKKTESTILTIEGADIDFDQVKDAIEQMGASVHSIDEVEVSGTTAD